MEMPIQYYVFILHRKMITLVHITHIAASTPCTPLNNEVHPHQIIIIHVYIPQPTTEWCGIPSEVFWIACNQYHAPFSQSCTTPHLIHPTHPSHFPLNWAVSNTHIHMQKFSYQNTRYIAFNERTLMSRWTIDWPWR